MSSLAAVAAMSRATLLPDTPARSEEQAYRKWALLIGCDEYINLKPLKCPGKDVLRPGGPTGGIGVPQGPDLRPGRRGQGKQVPSLPGANIDRELDQVLKLPQEGDLIVVMFSGHGVQVEGKDRWSGYPATATEGIDDRGGGGLQPAGTLQGGDEAVDR